VGSPARGVQGPSGPRLGGRCAREGGAAGDRPRRRRALPGGRAGRSANRDPDRPGRRGGTRRRLAALHQNARARPPTAMGSSRAQSIRRPAAAPATDTRYGHDEHGSSREGIRGERQRRGPHAPPPARAPPHGRRRVVDGGFSPPLAVDIAGLQTRVDNLSTAPGAGPARIDLKGRVGDGLVDLAGTIGPVTGPLRLDLKGDLREFAVPRTNPYLLNVFAWEARNGRLTTGIQCRIDGDKLQAKADVLVSRLQLAKAAGRDEAQARVGLPLGMLVSLMKDRHGDIRLALPIAGRLTDPRLDFKQLVWSTVRNATLKLIAAPVSWIGRVRVDADSRIQRREGDPIHVGPD